MAKIIPLLASFIVAGLFIIALMLGGLTLQIQNGAPALLTNDTGLNEFYLSVNQSLYGTSSQTDTAYQAFSNSSIQTSGVTPYLSAVGGIWKIITNAPVALYSLVVNFIFTRIFGNPLGIIFVAGIGAIVVMMIISAVIKLVSRGEGD